MNTALLMFFGFSLNICLFYQRRFIHENNRDLNVYRHHLAIQNIQKNPLLVVLLHSANASKDWCKCVFGAFYSFKYWTMSRLNNSALDYKNVVCESWPFQFDCVTFALRFINEWNGNIHKNVSKCSLSSVRKWPATPWCSAFVGALCPL